MQTNKPTAEQLKYLRYFAEREELARGWTQNPLAVWHATHPEGTTLSANALMWRIEKVFTGMKSQGWITETHVEHHYQDDEVNTRKFEETLYRITERGHRALVESGNAPVFTRRVEPAPRRTPDGTGHEEQDLAYTYRGKRPHDPSEDETMDATPTAETVRFAEGPADGRVVTLPAGRHDQVLFALGGRTVRYRRSRRPEVDGHAVFIPLVEEPAAVGA